MQPLLNEIDPESIREETFRGRDYLVAPTVPIRAMELDGGYVPSDHIEKSTPAWNGTPVTLNHPRDADGRLVSANSPGVAEQTWLGHLFNSQSIDGGAEMEGEVWLDIENARDLGGAAAEVIDDLRNGDSVSVSTSYFGDQLPAGTYDGAHREAVMGNLRPDHLAVLPHKEGKCAIADGCGAGEIAANETGLQVAMADDPADAGEDLVANESVAGVSFDGTKPGTLDESDLDAETHDLGDHYLYGSGDAKSDFSYPVVDADGNLRKGNVESAHELGCRGQCSNADAHDTRLSKLAAQFDDPPDFAANSLADRVAARVAGMFNWHEDDHPRDSGGKFIDKDVDLGAVATGDAIQVRMTNGDTINGVYSDADGSHVVLNEGWSRRVAEGSIDRVNLVERQAAAMNDTTTMTDADSDPDRDQMVNVLVEDHGFKESSLDGMGDTCLKQTYNSFTEDTDEAAGAEQEQGPDQDADQPPANATDAGGDGVSDADLDALVNERVNDIVDERVEEALANSQTEQQRQDLVDEITANSDEWDADSLADTPVSVLANIRDEVTTADAGAADFTAQRGASAGASNSNGSADDFPTLTANERLQEGDD